LESIRNNPVRTLLNPSLDDKQRGANDAAMPVPSLKVLLIALTGLAFATAVLSPPVIQALTYHQFADERPFFGIPNACNVLSNLAFLAVALAGCAELLRAGARLNRDERRMHGVFFAGLALTAAGSAYYHLIPDNDRLFWDRLPMTLAFASLLSLMVSERVEETFARKLFPALLAAGLASILWWRATRALGVENLLPYVIMQAYVMLSLLMLALLGRSRHAGGNLLWGIIVLYLMAKLAEHFDQTIMSATGIVSGHALKHLLAALGAYCIVLRLRRRTAL
jgi:hypothetical protein